MLEELSDRAQAKSISTDIWMFGNTNGALSEAIPFAKHGAIAAKGIAPPSGAADYR